MYFDDEIVTQENLDLLYELYEEVFYTKNSESYRRITAIADAVGVPKQARKRYDLLLRDLKDMIPELRCHLFVKENPWKKGDLVERNGIVYTISCIGVDAKLRLQGEKGAFHPYNFTKVEE